MVRYFLLFCLGFAMLGLGIWEGYLRLRPMEDEARIMSCLRLGGPEHHHFEENCESSVQTPAGPVAYRLNEDGFRARPRAEYAQGAVVMLGDSKVEGWWLGQEDTIGAGLERSGALGPWRELNLGIRYSGPSIQRLRMERALSHYPVRAVLWFLNGTDPVDEQLAHSLAVQRDSFGAPTQLSHDDVSPPSWLSWLQAQVGNRSALLRHLQVKLYDREVIRRVMSTDPGPEVVCASIRSAAARLKELRLPVIAVFLPLGPNIAKFPYMNLVDREEGSISMQNCVQEAGLPTIDLRERLKMNPELYWPSHRNMTAEGVRHLVGSLAPELRGRLEPYFRGRGRRP
jgi:hypothetical protein